MFGSVVAGLLVLTSIVLGSPWENKHLPAPISDSALVLALPGVRREAELAEIEYPNEAKHFAFCY